MACRDGLACVTDPITSDSVCLAQGNKQKDDKCLLTAECQPPEWISMVDGQLKYDFDKRCTDAEMKAAASGDEALALKCMGLHCSWAGFCVSPSYYDPEEEVADVQGGQVGAKAGAPGSSCAHSGECEYGLFCHIRGLGGVCAAAAPAGPERLLARCVVVCARV